MGFTERTIPTNSSTTTLGTGELTGLIGEEGAVGAFIIDSYFGGFVARPSSAAELRTVAQTCAADPFNSLCDIGYESERNALIEHCIIDGNFSPVMRTRCKFAHTSYACISLIRFKLIVMPACHNITNRRGQTALHFVGRQGMRE